MFDLPESAILFADSARGVFIPQFFAESIRREYVTGVSCEEYEILEFGPEHEFYFDVWHEVESRAIIESPEHGKMYLYQDGDLWLVPESALADMYV